MEKTALAFIDDHVMKNQSPDLNRTNIHQCPPGSILFADDDIDDQFFFREAVSEIDPSIRFEVVNTGQELLSRLKQHVPDLLFLNLHLPGKNMFQYLKEIRDNSQFQHIRVVVLCPCKRYMEEKKAYQPGAYQFFLKPFSYADLRSGLKKILQKE